MAVYLSPFGNDQVIASSTGIPLVGGYWNVFLAGTSTPVTTYTDNTGGTPQPTNITLDAAGRPANPIWITGGVPVKFRLSSAAAAVLLTIDNVSGINDPAGITSQDQWVLYGAAPTRVSATSFSLVGDQTGTFQIGRRLKSTNSGGTIYSSITASVFGAVTTVTVVNDSGTLDAGMSAVSYGILSATSPSVPTTYAKSGANADITSMTAITGLGNTAATHLTFTAAGIAGFQGAAAGVDGVNLPIGKNFGTAEGANSAYAVSFRQASSAAHVIASGLKYSATAGGFSSSQAGSWGHSAVVVASTLIGFYTKSATTVAVGTDVTMVEKLRLAADGTLSQVITSGSTLYPAFMCRAFVYFNGTGTPGVIAGGNVASITDNGIGDYTVNFTTNMADANYTAIGSAGDGNANVCAFQPAYQSAPSASSCRCFVNGGFAAVDRTYVYVAFFR